MTIRDSFSRGVPPWMMRKVMGRILWSVGLVLDATNALVREGIRARMPGEGTPDALPVIGDDRLIDRGPTEPDDNYAERLANAFNTWRTMGNAYRLIENIAAFFTPNNQGLRLVSDRSVWHTLDLITGAIVKQKGDPLGADNWHWDTLAAGSPPYRWWRGWVIIDAAGRWTQWHVGTDGVIVGDGHTVGSTATLAEVASIRRIVKRCKPAKAHVVKIIITFVNGIFDASKAITDSPMPNGNYHILSNRSLDAIYWAGVGTRG